MADLNQLASTCVDPVETVILMTDTLDEALASLRRKKIPHKIVYIYVVDENHQLQGVVSTRELLLGNSHDKIEKIMNKNVIKMQADEIMHNALALFTEHPLLALPVVDKIGKFIGKMHFYE
jgi:magnesium transporter